jgi:hypothetical protein
MPQQAKTQTITRAAAPDPPKPAEFHIAGKPWSLVFAPLPRFLDQQGVWLFNEEKGELWELVANSSFVLRPRQQG